MGCGTSQVEVVVNEEVSRKGQGDNDPHFQRDSTSLSTAGLIPSGREISFMSPGDMQNLAAVVNLTLEEAEVLYLRFKLLEPDRSSNMIFVSKFSEKIGTGFRHNTILYKFVKAIHNDDAALDLLAFFKLMKWWKLADPRQKCERIYDLYDLDADGVLEKDEVVEMLGDLKCFEFAEDGSSSSSGSRVESGSVTEYPDELLNAIGWNNDQEQEQLCHKSQFVTYMLDNRVDALHAVLNISDNEVYDREGKRINTGIMKSRSQSRKESNSFKR